MSVFDQVRNIWVQESLLRLLRVNPLVEIEVRQVSCLPEFVVTAKGSLPHGPAASRAERTPDKFPLGPKSDAYLTEPVPIRDLGDTIAFLMDTDVTPAAKHNQVVIPVIPIIADEAHEVLSFIRHGQW